MASTERWLGRKRAGGRKRTSNEPHHLAFPSGHPLHDGSLDAKAGSDEKARPATARRGACLAFLLVVPLAIALAWTSIVPAVALPTLGSQQQPTIAAGGSLSLYSLVVDNQGWLWSWGYNSDGQLGDGTRTDRSVPGALVAGDDWAAVFAGWSHSLALEIDGSLYAWGDNYYGQLGDGSNDDRLAPTPIGDIDIAWKTVSAGGTHCLGVRNDGSLWAWGNNECGQLGEGTGSDRNVPTRVGTDSDWTAVSAGAHHSLALKSDGSLWAWGSSEYGQVGDGFTDDVYEPTRIGWDTDWAVVSAGGFHSLALKSDGSLWAWGWNAWGQLGDGSVVCRLMPTQIGTDDDWVAITGGDRHSLALKSGGSLWSWGANESGQLGDGFSTYLNVPTVAAQVGSDTMWREVSAGYYHSLAINGSGMDRSLWAWGENKRGWLGVGVSDVDQLSPVPISGVTSSTTTTIPSTTTTTQSSSTTTTLPGSQSFSDVPASHPYYTAINGMADAGVIGGYTDGTFGPENPVMRQQFAKMIVGTLGFPCSEADICPFTDVIVGGPSTLYPDNYVAVAAANEITRGTGGGKFGPYLNITRAQVITMVVRAAQQHAGGLEAPDAAYQQWGLLASFNDPTHGYNVRLAEFNGLLDGIQGSVAPSAWIWGSATRGEVAQILWNLINVAGLAG